MPKYLLPSETDFNLSQGFDQLLLYIADQVPSFMPMFLLSVFLIVGVGGFFIEERATNRGNILKWAAIASYITFAVTMILSLLEGLIPGVVTSVVVGITALTSLMYIFSTRSGI